MKFICLLLLALAPVALAKASGTKCLGAMKPCDSDQECCSGVCGGTLWGNKCKMAYEKDTQIVTKDSSVVTIEDSEEEDGNKQDVAGSRIKCSGRGEPCKTKKDCCYLESFECDFDVCY